MALALTGLDVSYIADEAMSNQRCVILTAVGHVEYPAAAKGGPIAGILLEASAASGDVVRVRKSGIAKAKFGTTTTIGQTIGAHDANGLVGVPTAAWASGDDVIGMVEEAVAASGDVAAVWLNIREILP